MQAEQVDYSDQDPDEVSADAAWGYCDKKCHADARDLRATVLQEVKLYSLKRDKLMKKTQDLQGEDLKFRPKVDLTLLD